MLPVLLVPRSRFQPKNQHQGSDLQISHLCWLLGVERKWPFDDRFVFFKETRNVLPQLLLILFECWWRWYFLVFSWKTRRKPCVDPEWRCVRWGEKLVVHLGRWQNSGAHWFGTRNYGHSLGVPGGSNGNAVSELRSKALPLFNTGP